MLILFSGASYHARLVFTDASGLVSGDPVMIGPAQVGEVKTISLTRAGQAAVTISVSSAAAPLHAGTVARIEDNGLASIAGHYVTLQPGSSSGAVLSSGVTIPLTQTHSEVSLDQLFDSFDAPTRTGLARTIEGEANAITGRSGDANRTLAYLDPALASTAAVTGQLTRYGGSFDRLLVSGATTMQALAARAGQLTQLVSSTATATGAIASQSTALDRTLAELPTTLTRSTHTFATLQRTLDTLTPVIAVARPAVAQLRPFSRALDTLTGVARPTVADLARLLPAAAALLEGTPGLDAVATRAFPDTIAAMNASQVQLNTLRSYTPDVVASLTNLGQASANYDANGHYVRTMPFFDAFGVDSANALTPRSPADRYAGLTKVTARCPGSAVEPSPDGSTPYVVSGCDAAETP